MSQQNASPWRISLQNIDAWFWCSASRISWLLARVELVLAGYCSMILTQPTICLTMTLIHAMILIRQLAFLTVSMQRFGGLWTMASGFIFSRSNGPQLDVTKIYSVNGIVFGPESVCWLTPSRISSMFFIRRFLREERNPIHLEAARFHRLL